MPYGSRFPVVTIRDMVRAQARLGEHLGVARWMVGHRAGLWAECRPLSGAVMYPRRVRSVVPIATCMQATAQADRMGRYRSPGNSIGSQVAWRRLLRGRTGDGPGVGLSIARQIAQVTVFRSDNVLN